jgi:CRP-like cAMP-binding protein
LRDELLKCGRIRSRQRGDVLFHQGDPADGLYGVISGTLALDVTKAQSGPFRLHLFRHGEWVGETVLFDNRPRNFTVIATETTKLLYLASGELDKLAERYTDLWRWIGALSAIHLELAISAYCDLVTTQPVERLAAILVRLSTVRLASDAQDKACSNIDITQNDLALMAGVSRATIRNELMNLQALGLIDCGYRYIRIGDADALTAIARGRNGHGAGV